MDCGGKRSATPLSLARKSFSFSTARKHVAAPALPAQSKMLRVFRELAACRRFFWSADFPNPQQDKWNRQRASPGERPKPVTNRRSSGDNPLRNVSTYALGDGMTAKSKSVENIMSFCWIMSLIRDWLKRGKL